MEYEFTKFYDNKKVVIELSNHNPHEDTEFKAYIFTLGSDKPIKILKSYECLCNYLMDDDGSHTPQQETLLNDIENEYIEFNKDAKCSSRCEQYDKEAQEEHNDLERELNWLQRG